VSQHSLVQLRVDLVDDAIRCLDEAAVTTTIEAHYPTSRSPESRHERIERDEFDDLRQATRRRSERRRWEFHRELHAPKRPHRRTPRATPAKANAYI
jgi:hypothetical protein